MRNELPAVDEDVGEVSGAAIVDVRCVGVPGEEAR